MIEINLLPGAKKKKAGGKAFTLPDLKALSGLVKDPWMIAFIASWVLVALMVGLLYLPKRAHLADLEPKFDAAQREAQRMQRVLATRRQYEARRDSLMRQMAVIANIDRERYVWPHILQEVTRALPQYTWIDDLQPRSGGSAVAGTEAADSGAGTLQAFQITGKSADIQAITRFVRNLEESPFIQNFATISTGSVMEQDKQVYTFTLTAQYQRPDSTLLTMEPLSTTLVQGVRSGGGARPTGRR